MNNILKKDFFKSKNTIIIAKKLLGNFLVRQHKGKIKKYIITEVEAYDGFEDKASHAYCGKTERNKIMFEEGGYWYVYLTYGMHWMLNIVTGPKNYPAAVLIRGAEEVSGPARLTKFLKIDKKFNGKLACPLRDNKKTKLWIETSDKKNKLKIKSIPRVGVNYAGKIWANKRYRFILDEKKRNK
ncbi:DNA-3-methyladenine glycosylase [Patescibacteria group bacterium]|nr:DNA-3-methyladenine glycosylase [Patescibacteria group bacterium]